MVTQVTSLTRSGLSDFLVQRVSAVIIALYTLCVLGFFLVTPSPLLQPRSPKVPGTYAGGGWTSVPVGVCLLRRCTMAATPSS